jgi:hypothetical protein
MDVDLKYIYIMNVFKDHGVSIFFCMIFWPLIFHVEDMLRGLGDFNMDKKDL